MAYTPAPVGLDDAPFGIGTDHVSPSGYLGDETSTDPIDEGDIGLARMNPTTRIQLVELRDQSGDSAMDDANNAVRVNVVLGGGGGGGAMTVADGADVAGGATTDAAVTTDATGTRSGKLRGLVKILGSAWDSVNGRLKVDASAVAVPVTDNGGSLTVDGPLTDTQLRATAVPISGTIIASGPLTDTQLRATPVPVSGAVTANQGTAGASAWPVIHLSTTPTRTSVASSSSVVTLLASNANRRGATIFNDSTKVLSIALGSGVTSSDFTQRLGASAYYEIPFGYTGIVTGIWAAANGSARITELV